MESYTYDEVIRATISFLDARDDALLIKLLEDKIEARSAPNVPISKTERHNAFLGCRTLIRNHLRGLLDNDYTHLKIIDILDNFDCDTCKFSITKKGMCMGEDYSFNTSDNTDRCARCGERQQFLLTKDDKIRESYSTDIIDFDDEHIQELITLKSVINKMRRKITELNNN